MADAANHQVDNRGRSPAEPTDERISIKFGLILGSGAPGQGSRGVSRYSYDWGGGWGLPRWARWGCRLDIET